AVGEERAVAGAEVDVPRVELGEVGDDLDHPAALAGDQVLHARHELVVRQPPERSEDVRLHGSFYRARRSGQVRSPRRRSEGREARPAQLLSSFRIASDTPAPFRIAAARAICWRASSITSGPAPRSMSPRARTKCFCTTLSPTGPSRAMHSSRSRP